MTITGKEKKEMTDRLEKEIREIRNLSDMLGDVMQEMRNSGKDCTDGINGIIDIRFGMSKLMDRKESILEEIHDTYVFFKN
jgi:uncharacterized protein (UPF0335 family)